MHTETSTRRPHYCGHRSHRTTCVYRFESILKTDGGRTLRCNLPGLKHVSSSPSQSIPRSARLGGWRPLAVASLTPTSSSAPRQQSTRAGRILALASRPMVRAFPVRFAHPHGRARVVRHSRITHNAAAPRGINTAECSSSLIARQGACRTAHPRIQTPTGPRSIKWDANGFDGFIDMGPKFKP